MRAFTVTFFSLLATAVRAYSNLPPELQVLGNSPQVLDVGFPLRGPPFVAVVHPGHFLQNNDTAIAPQVNVAPLDPLSPPGRPGNPDEADNKFVFMMVDPDINTTDPTYVGLHTMYADVMAESDCDASDYTVIAKFIGPIPPAGQAHNYTLLAFHQPAGFSIPPKYASYVATTAESPLNRINFPLVQFIQDANLGPLAASNWFRDCAIDCSAFHGL